MNAPVTETQWYIARDSKQHGPLTDIEMRTFVAHSYLRVSDLIWRPGMPEWTPAPQVFPAAFQNTAPPAAAPVIAPQIGPISAPHGSATHTSDFDGDETEQPAPRRSAGRTLVLAATIISIIGGGAFALATYHEPLMRLVSGETSGTVAADASQAPVVPAPTTEVAAPSPDAAPETTASTDVQPDASSTTPQSEPAPATAAQSETGTQVVAALTPDAPASPPNINGSQIDARLQKIPVWALIKKDYPDWYVGHIAAAEKLSADKRPETDIAMHLAQGLVTLRRQHADKALQASPEKLRRVAAAFLDNLKALQGQSVSACYGFISKGETSPAIVTLMQAPESATAFNAHVNAIFEAIDDGSKTPAKHDAAVKGDYDILIKELGKIGWKEEDLQVFSNPRLLSKRPPELVCKMVLEWFIAHLAVKDKAVQDRLLYETLKPVVTG